MLNTIAATMRTEQLLQQSQALAEELQSQQLQCKPPTRSCRKRRSCWPSRRPKSKPRISEVEQAKKALEEKAEQLALTSKYKSEFLANMSHELRTPLNNLLILARMLAENSDKNLTPEAGQVRRNDSHLGNRSAGADQRHSRSQQDRIRQDGRGNRQRALHRTARLLRRRPSGTWRTARASDFSIELGSSLSSEVMHTDAKRLQQVLKNLLSNALKFTEHGSVQLHIDKATSGWSASHIRF